MLTDGQMRQMSEYVVKRTDEPNLVELVCKRWGEYVDRKTEGPKV